MKYALFVIFIFIFSAAVGQGFEYPKVFGYAIDSFSRKPLLKARIVARDSLNKIMYEEASNTQGYFELTKSIGKIATLSIEYPSYKTYTFWMWRSFFGKKSLDTVFLVPEKNILKPLSVASKQTFRK